MDIIDKRGHQVDFVSNDRDRDFPDEYRLLIGVMREFGIFRLSQLQPCVSYKTGQMARAIRATCGPLCFYDDDPRMLSDAGQFGHVTTINTSGVMDWRRKLVRMQ